MSKPWLKPQLAGCPDASAIQPEASVPYDPASCPKPAQAHLIPLLLPTADTGKMWMDLSFSKIQKALGLGSVFHLLPVWTPHPSIMGPAPGPALHSSCGLKMAQYTLLFWTRLLMRVGWTASMENLLTTRRFTSAQCITEYKTKDYPDGNPQLDLSLPFSHSFAGASIQRYHTYPQTVTSLRRIIPGQWQTARFPWGRTPAQCPCSLRRPAAYNHSSTPPISTGAWGLSELEGKEKRLQKSVTLLVTVVTVSIMHHFPALSNASLSSKAQHRCKPSHALPSPGKARG